MLATAAAPAHAARHHHAHHARCRKGMVRRKGHCFPRVSRLPVVVPSTPRAVPVDSTLRALARIRSHRRRHVSPTRVRRALRHVTGLGALVRAADGLLSPPGTRAAPPRPALARTAGAGTKGVDAGGWHGGATVDVPVHDGLTGTDGSVSVDVDRKDGTKAKLSQTRKALVANCPDGQGDVPGEVERRDSYRFAIPPKEKGGIGVVIHFSFGATAKVEGHTADDGTLHDWDQSVRFTAHMQVAAVRGDKVLSTNEPWLWVINAHRNLTPSGSWDLGPGDYGKTVVPGMFSFLGIELYSTGGGLGEATDAVSKVFGSTWVLVAHDARNAFAEAEKQHWSAGDCVKLALSAPKDRMHAGESMPVTATVTAPGGGGQAPAQVTATVDGRGTVSPTAIDGVTAPVTFTTTAPAPFDTGDGYEVHAGAVSKQGRATAVLVVHGASPSYQLRFVHTEQGSVSGSYDRSQSTFVDRGTWQEARDVQVTATVALQRNPDGTWSGSAPIGWDRHSWSTEDQNTSTSQGGTLCSSDDRETLTGVDGGTLTVSSLQIGAAVSGAFEVAGLDEHWHQDDEPTGGPCPGRVDDYDQQVVLGNISFDQSRLGDRPANDYDAGGTLRDARFTAAHGWQAGTGDVVATRSVSGAFPSDVTPAGQSIPFSETWQIVRVSG